MPRQETNPIGAYLHYILFFSLSQQKSQLRCANSAGAVAIVATAPKYSKE